MSLTTSTKLNLTFEEFINYDDGTDNIYELVNGSLVLMPEPTRLHEDIAEYISFCLKLEINRLQMGYTVQRGRPVKLDKKDGKRPDVLVVSREKWGRKSLEEAALLTAPDLAIEVVSTNWQEDYQKKPLWYAALGVPEYWIIDALATKNPKFRNPRITMPTVSVLTLISGKYQTREFAASERIESNLFPELELTMNQILAGVD